MPAAARFRRNASDDFATGAVCRLILCRLILRCLMPLHIRQWCCVLGWLYSPTHNCNVPFRSQ